MVNWDEFTPIETYQTKWGEEKNILQMCIRDRDILTQEVIPGVTISDSAPQGAQAGSIGMTSAKPYTR